MTIAPTISNCLSDRRMAAPREGHDNGHRGYQRDAGGDAHSQGHSADEGAVCATHEFAAR